jgi:hypothetical protein
MSPGDDQSEGDSSLDTEAEEEEFTKPLRGAAAPPALSKMQQETNDMARMIRQLASENQVIEKKILQTKSQSDLFRQMSNRSFTSLSNRNATCDGPNRGFIPERTTTNAAREVEAVPEEPSYRPPGAQTRLPQPQQTMRCCCCCCCCFFSRQTHKN